jgi:hypothetical protein
MAKYDTVVLAGAEDPVTFFGYEGIPSHVIPGEATKIAIHGPGQDLYAVLEALADSVDAVVPAAAEGGSGPEIPSLPTGSLTPETVSLVIAALQPEGGIVVDEGLTTSFPYYPLSHGCPPHGFMTIAGGAIGYGMPCAVGAALAAPERPIINIQADGSAMYTVQALWTMAREGLEVTTLLCNNGGYRIIAMELERAGLTDLTKAGRALVDIDGPGPAAEEGNMAVEEVIAARAALPLEVEQDVGKAGFGEEPVADLEGLGNEPRPGGGEGEPIAARAPPGTEVDGPEMAPLPARHRPGANRPSLPNHPPPLVQEREALERRQRRRGDHRLLGGAALVAHVVDQDDRLAGDRPCRAKRQKHDERQGFLHLSPPRHFNIEKNRSTVFVLVFVLATA